MHFPVFVVISLCFSIMILLNLFQLVLIISSEVNWPIFALRRVLSFMLVIVVGILCFVPTVKIIGWRECWVRGQWVLRVDPEAWIFHFGRCDWVVWILLLFSDCWRSVSLFIIGIFGCYALIKEVNFLRINFIPNLGWFYLQKLVIVL